MNSLVEEITAIRDANLILIDIVCDPMLSIQGLMILDRVQIQLVRRQVEILKELNNHIKRHELTIVRGTA